MESGTVFHARRGRTHVVKFVGDIRYTMGCSVDDFLDWLFQQGDLDDILVDLTETTSIDSTSLGLLAKIGNFLAERFQRTLTIVSTNEDVNTILDSVGFCDVFNVSDLPPCEVGVGTELPIGQPSETALARTLLEAHRLLCDLNEKNREEFRNVVEALESEVSERGS